MTFASPNTKKQTSSAGNECNTHSENVSPFKTSATVSNKLVSLSKSTISDLRVPVNHHHGSNRFFWKMQEVFTLSFICVWNQMPWSNLQKKKGVTSSIILEAVLQTACSILRFLLKPFGSNQNERTICWTVKYLLSKTIRWMAPTCLSVIEVFGRLDQGSYVLYILRLYYAPHFFIAVWERKSSSNFCTIYSWISFGVISFFFRLFVTVWFSVLSIFRFVSRFSSLDGYHLHRN